MINLPIVNITDLSADGRGVAQIDGKVVFVSAALPSEQVKIKFTRTKRSYNEAKTVEIIQFAKNRIKPKCQYFGLCGGCALQHLPQIEQINFKQKSLLNTLSKQAKVKPENLLEPVVSKPWGYRRKARLGVKLVSKKGGVLVGFREVASNFLTVMDSCEVLHPQVGLKIKALKLLINSLQAASKIAQIEVAVADNATILIFRNLIALSDDDINLLDSFGKQNQLNIYTQSAGPNTIKPLNEEHFVQLQYSVLGLTYNFNPNDFTQVNFDINKKMIALAIELLQLSKNDLVLDFFCGLGNFSLPLARHAKLVLGLELNNALVKAAKENAKLNNIENAQFLECNLQTQDIAGSWLKQSWNKVLLDPPRSGAKEILPLIASLKPSHILYVSCNPATLARDTDILVNDYNYKCKNLAVLDMFPNTAHVESMTLFTLHGFT